MKFRFKLRNLYYKLRYGIIIRFDQTLLYKLGRGKYVDVIRKGNYLDIINHETIVTPEKTEFIRLVPYQPNHGIMIEYWKDNKLRWRNHCDFEMFKNLSKLVQEKEEKNSIIKEYWEAICYYCDRIYRIEKGTVNWKCECGFWCYIRKFQKKLKGE